MQRSAHEWYGSYLQQGEEVLWQGRPQSNPFFTEENAPIILLLPLCTAFLAGIGAAMYFMLTSGLQAEPVLLLGTIALLLPLVFYLIYIGYGQWVLPYLRLRRTEYLVTNKRVLRKVGSRIDALDTNRLPEITLRPEKKGYGSLLFSRHPMEMSSSYGRNNAPEFHGVRKEPFALWHVAESKRVQTILCSLGEKGGAS